MEEQERPAEVDAGAPATRPLTGDEYIESLRDAREIWIYGERVKDVTTHPAFRNAVRMTARLYDALHDPDRAKVLTARTDTGSDGFTHKFFRTPKSVQDLVEDRDAIAEWARLTYGWMGRSPDYKALSMLGFALDRNGDHERAIEVLKRAVKLRPDGFLALHYLGEAYQALERREEAIAAYEAELRVRPQSLEVQRRVRALRNAGS